MICWYHWMILWLTVWKDRARGLVLSVRFSVLSSDDCVYLRMCCVIIVKESTSTRNHVFFYVFKGTDSYFQAIECCDSSVPVCQVVHLSGKTRYNFFVYGIYFPYSLSLHPYIEAANGMESNVYFTMLYAKRRDPWVELTHVTTFLICVRKVPGSTPYIHAYMPMLMRSIDPTFSHKW